jgi:hypothetical protein
MKQKLTLIVLAILFVVASSFAQEQRVLSLKHLPSVGQQSVNNVKQQLSKKSL